MLEIDPDFLNRLGTGELIDSGDGKDRIALVEGFVGERALAPLAGLNHRAVIVHAICLGWNVISSEDGLYTGDRQRIIQVDALDARVRHRTQYQPAKKHAFGAEVLSIFCLAGDFGEHIVGGIVFANELVTGAIHTVGWLRLGWFFLTVFKHAQALLIYSAPRIMASRILL